MRDPALDRANPMYPGGRRLTTRCPICRCIPKFAYSSPVAGGTFNVVTCSSHYCRDLIARAKVCVAPAAARDFEQLERLIPETRIRSPAVRAA